MDNNPNHNSQENSNFYNNNNNYNSYNNNNNNSHSYNNEPYNYNYNLNQNRVHIRDKCLACISYFSILFLLISIIVARNVPFVKFHINQAIVHILFNIVCVVTAIALFFIITIISYIIPFFAITLSLIVILAIPLFIFNLICLICGILNSIRGIAKPLPIIGKWAIKLNFIY